MGATTTATMKEQPRATDANANGAQLSAETCDELRERMGIKVRTMQRRWRDVFGVPYSARKIATLAEVAEIERLYKKHFRPAQRKKAEKPVFAPVLKAAKKVEINWRKLPVFACFIIPTGASISNTINVSHSLSGSAVTGLFITGVASLTAILMIFGRVRNFFSWVVVAITLAFEAFCNAVTVFKSLMQSMAYGLSTVIGKPSEFLDMVATFTGKDHHDTGVALAVFTAAMICIVQVAALYELKK